MSVILYQADPLHISVSVSVLTRNLEQLFLSALSPVKLLCGSSLGPQRSSKPSLLNQTLRLAVRAAVPANGSVQFRSVTPH